MHQAETDPVDVACRIHERAEHTFASGRQQRGLRWRRKALAILNNSLGHDHPDVANVQNSLGQMLQSSGALQEAMNCFRDSLELMERIDMDIPEVHIIRAQSAMHLGNALREAGHYREAEPYLRRAVKDLEQHAPGNRGILAGAWNILGMFCKYTGKFEEGIDLYRRALAAASDEWGPDHPEVASIYHNIGGIHHARGAYAEAEEPARRSVEIRRAALGPGHPAVAADEAAYAAVLDELGRYRESAVLYEQALGVFRNLYGDEHYEIAANLNNLAAVAAATGDPEKAEQLYRQSLGMKERLLGVEHPDTALTACNLAGLLEESGRIIERRPVAARAWKTFREQLDPTHPSVAAAGALVERLSERALSAGSSCAPSD